MTIIEHQLPTTDMEEENCNNKKLPP